MINADGAKAIGVALQKNTSLNKLNISIIIFLNFTGRNLIGSEGACSISQSLKLNNTLKILNLRIAYFYHFQVKMPLEMQVLKGLEKPYKSINH